MYILKINRVDSALPRSHRSIGALPSTRICGAAGRFQLNQADGSSSLPLTEDATEGIDQQMAEEHEEVLLNETNADIKKGKRPGLS